MPKAACGQPPMPAGLKGSLAGLRVNPWVAGGWCIRRSDTDHDTRPTPIPLALSVPKGVRVWWVGGGFGYGVRECKCFYFYLAGAILNTLVYQYYALGSKA